MLNRKAALAFCLGCAVTGANAAVVDAFDLDTGSAAGTMSNISLEAGKTYILTVSGTFRLGSNPTRHVADAEYFNLGGSGLTPLDGVSSQEIGVGVDGMDIAFGPFNPSNVYSTRIVGTGSAINVFYQDSNYGDNVGSLSVQLSTIPLPAGALLLLTGLGAFGVYRKLRS